MSPSAADFEFFLTGQHTWGGSGVKGGQGKGGRGEGGNAWYRALPKFRTWGWNFTGHSPLKECVFRVLQLLGGNSAVRSANDPAI